MKKNNKKNILEKIEKVRKQVYLVKNAINTKYNSQYITLNKLLRELEPSLSANGLIVLNKIKENKLVTILADKNSNQKIATEMPLIFKEGDMQSLASAITYARRYALMTLLNLVADDVADDDGNLAKK